MKIFRFMRNDQVRSGVLEDVELVMIEGDPFGEWRRSDERVKLSEVRLLAPCSPSKVVALGLNYRDHAAEMKMPLPAEPILFLKPGTAVIGPGEEIEYPGGGITARVDYEAELGVVIGRRCKNALAADAANYIKGYVCLNDVTARDLQQKDGQWTRAKSFDTFCPIGPAIETDLDPTDVAVRAILNGQTVQSSSTGQLIFNVPQIIELVSRVMTLLPQDVIATGTPAGIGPMKPGDSITIQVEGVGALTNQVRRSRE